MAITFFLVIGFILLYFGAEWLVKGAVAVAERLGLTPLVIGLTVVAFGTSMPEMTVSIQAAFTGSGDIAATNVVGSNIFNIALILGLAAVIRPIHITPQLIKFDIPVMIGISLVAVGVLFDRALSRMEGVLLFSGIIGYTGYSFYLAKKKASAEILEKAEELISEQESDWLRAAAWRAWGAVVVGLVLLVLGSKALIAGSIQLARAFGISEAVIGLTIVSAGTSLPELATSVMAAIRKQSDISIGNIIGSNIFNVLCILGCSSMLKPYAAPGITWVDLYFMLAIAVLSLPLMWTGFRLSRWKGAFLLICYGGYLWHLWPR